MQLENSLAFAKTLDEGDFLKDFRHEFIIPQHQNADAIYFLGNSLGLQPKRTADYIKNVLDQWGKYGVEGFFKGPQPWLRSHQRLAATLSEVVGARPHEVVVMNQLTVNLHLMLASFYQPQGKRNKILCEAKAFPSDQYMLQTHVRQRGFDPDEIIIEVEPRKGETVIREEDILTAIELHNNELALVFLGGVNYYTGQLFNMQVITNAAHRAGAKAGYDLAHAAGNVPLYLRQWNVDFACWCSYKYLNAGPGAVAGVYIHERYHHDGTINRFAGWWGNKKETQFLMQKSFEPAPSAEGWSLSTPSPVLYATLQASLSVFEEAGVQNVLAKNDRLNDWLHFVLEDVVQSTPGENLKILTPKSKGEKGCQVSIVVQGGKQIFDELSINGVFADWREPDVIRIAPVGLYNSFEEVWQFAQILKTAIIKFSK
jgi:kynureninase